MYRIILEVGPFTLYSYGLFVAIAFILATILIVTEAPRYAFSSDDIFDCAILMFAGGLIGGRVLFVVLNWGNFSDNFLNVFKLYEGGLAFQGALIGGAIAVITVCVFKKLPIRKVGDLLAPYIALGQAIGRIGCFLNGCCYGKVVSSGVGITFPDETVMRVPVQLYSSFALLLIFVILAAYREKRHFSGAIFAGYLVLYGIVRFFMDFARGDELHAALGITLSQALGIGTFLCGVILYVIFKRIQDK